MIEAIKEIGRYAGGDTLDMDMFLEGICKKIPETKKDKNGNEIDQHVVILNFNTKNGKIDIDFEKVNAGGKDSGKEYVWVGNNPGAKEQIFFTTDNPIYLFTKTLPNIKNRAESSLKSDIENILRNFFTENNGNCIIISSKFSLFEDKIKIIKESISKINEEIPIRRTKKDLNDLIKEIKRIYGEVNIKCDIPTTRDIEEVKNIIKDKCDELMDSIEEKLVAHYTADILKRTKPQGNKRESSLTNDYFNINSLSKDNVLIYTCKLNGKSLVNTSEYKNMLYYEKIDSLFDNRHKSYKKNLLSKGICSICGSEENKTTSNATNIDFKCYMTDKPGFSSNLDGGFTKNYNICKNCYQYLMVGENFIEHNLRTRIGDLKTYVIPHFFIEIDRLDIEAFSKYLINSTNSIVNLDSLKELQNILNKFQKYETEKNNHILNYLFYHKPQRSEFKILKLIKDVPPSRLNFIRNKEEEINRLVDDNYDQNRFLKTDLNGLWNMMPIKKGEKDSYSGFSRYLEIIDAIFSDKKIDYDFLVEQFTEVIRIIRFDTQGYNIWTKQDFTNKILQMNFSLLFFQKLNMIDISSTNEVKCMDRIQEILPDDILDYWKDIGIYADDSRKALFLLGFLIGEIGNAQSGSKIKKKPILNKVNFQGMGAEKLIRLTNEIPEKLLQYKLLQYDENIYLGCHMLFEKYIDDWKLSNQENVFYTLSGYTFSNYLVRKRSKEKYYKILREMSELIDKIKKEGKDIEEMEAKLKDAKEHGENMHYYEARMILKEIEEVIKEVE